GQQLVVQREVIAVGIQVRVIERLDDNVTSQILINFVAGKDHGSTPIFGQIFSRTHDPHSGRRALQIRRPCQIRRCEKLIHSSCGSCCIRSRSIFTASSCSVSPSRCESRVTCVSTTTPVAMSNAVPNTTFAVFLPTPGKCTSLSMSAGTSPPCSF